MSMNQWAGTIRVKTDLTKTHFLPAIKKPNTDPDTLIRGNILHVLERNRFGDCLCVVFDGEDAIGLVDVDHEDVLIFVPQRAIQIVKTGIDPEGSIESLVIAGLDRMEKGEDISPVIDALLNKMADRGAAPESAADLFTNMMKGRDHDTAETIPNDKPDPASP